MNLIPFVSEQREPSLRRALLGWLMRLANRNPHRIWYAHKPVLLLWYGVQDGFDTQRYEAPCWSCGGTGGEWDGSECPDCNNGVHHVTRTVLDRWKVEGMVFHQVVETGRIWGDEQLEEMEAMEGWHRRLTGRVKHKKTSECVSREAEAWIVLLLGYYGQVWKWLNGEGSFGTGTYHVGLPLGTLRWVLTRPRWWARRFREWRLRHAWIWRDGLLEGLRKLRLREWREVPF